MIRLAGALLIEQNDEWPICRRYLPAESIALLDTTQDQEDHAHEVNREEAIELSPA